MTDPIGDGTGAGLGGTGALPGGGGTPGSGALPAGTGGDDGSGGAMGAPDAGLDPMDAAMPDDAGMDPPDGAMPDDAGMDPPDGAMPDDAGMDEPDPPLEWVDPGTLPWEPVPPEQVEEVCGLDLAALQAAEASLDVPWAVVRYGQLCYEHYPLGEDAMTAAEVYSTTKTFGAVVVGVASYETRELERNGRKTGQLSEWDRVDHWLDTFSYNADAHVAHVLAMVAHNADLSYGQKQHSYDTTGDVQINTLSDMINAAIAQDPDRLGADLEVFTQRFVFDPLGMQVSTWTGGAADKVFGYTWSSSVRDMARVGLLVLNRGMWNGTRLLEEAWAYKMTHPAFEDGNTGYGYLTWLSSWSNHSIGFSPPTGQGANVPCTPVALWGNYPHGPLSEAADCNYEAPYDCEQGFDVGVSQAVGLGGQVIQVHPGLDLVIAVRNDPLGGAGAWPAILPAVVDADPMYTGDQDAFCAAYEANEYAPDLRGPWQDVPP